MKMRDSAPAPVVFAWVAGAVCLLASGQATTPPQTQTVFKAGVDLVHLDVSVLDRDRKPVRGLTAADFTILDGGSPRAVAAFAEMTVKAPAAQPPDRPAAAPSLVDAAPADVQTNEIARTPEGRLFVLILDDAMVPKDPKMIATAKEIADTAISRLSPEDTMAVVFTADSRSAQNFTSDHAKLRRAVSAFNPGYATHVMGWDNATWNDEKQTWERQVDGDDGFRAGSIRTLEMVAESLIAAPQRRKAILYVSTGVFADVEGAAGLVAAAPGQSQMIREGMRSLVGRLGPLFRRMREGNVTIYALDPAGLGGLQDYVLRRSAGLPALTQSRPTMSLSTDDWYNPSQPPLPMLLSQKMAAVNLDFLKTAAANTGGVAITDTNDLAGGMNRIFDENGSYYLVGFSIPPGHRPGSLHRLEVKVNRPGVTVRARSGYEVPESPSPSARGGDAKAAPGAAATILAGPIPAGALPMRVAVAPYGPVTQGDRDATVLIALGLEHGSSAKERQALDVELRAFSAEGKTALAERRTAQLRAAAGDGTFDLLARIALPPGRYELRFGAHVSPANLAGSVFADVDVPDFERNAVSLSGVMIQVDRGNAGPLDAFAGLTTIIPTSSRLLSSYDQPKAFVRVHQGGRAPLARVSLRVRLYDRTNEMVYNNRHPLQPNKFDAATRAADFTFAIPTQALKPGAYLLDFEAQLGEATVQRQVKFTYR